MQGPLHGVALMLARLRLSGDFLIVPGDLWMLTEKGLLERQLIGLCVSKNRTEGPVHKQ
jgi:hypothetical protein